MAAQESSSVSLRSQNQQKPKPHAGAVSLRSQNQPQGDDQPAVSLRSQEQDVPAEAQLEAGPVSLRPQGEMPEPITGDPFYPFMQEPDRGGKGIRHGVVRGLKETGKITAGTILGIKPSVVEELAQGVPTTKQMAEIAAKDETVAGYLEELAAVNAVAKMAQQQELEAMPQSEIERYQRKPLFDVPEYEKHIYKMPEGPPTRARPYSEAEMGQLFRQILLERSMRRAQAWQEEHPYATITGQVAGYMPQILTAMGIVRKAAGIATKEALKRTTSKALRKSVQAFTSRPWLLGAGQMGLANPLVQGVNIVGGRQPEFSVEDWAVSTVTFGIGTKVGEVVGNKIIRALVRRKVPSASAIARVMTAREGMLFEDLERIRRIASKIHAGTAELGQEGAFYLYDWARFGLTSGEMPPESLGRRAYRAVLEAVGGYMGSKAYASPQGREAFADKLQGITDDIEARAIRTLETRAAETPQPAELKVTKPVEKKAKPGEGVMLTRPTYEPQPKPLAATTAKIVKINAEILSSQTKLQKLEEARTKDKLHRKEMNQLKIRIRELRREREQLISKEAAVLEAKAIVDTFETAEEISTAAKEQKAERKKRGSPKGSKRAKVGEIIRRAAGWAVAEDMPGGPRKKTSLTVEEAEAFATKVESGEIEPLRITPVKDGVRVYFKGGRMLYLAAPDSDQHFRQIFEEIADQGEAGFAIMPDRLTPEQQQAQQDAIIKSTVDALEKDFPNAILRFSDVLGKTADKAISRAIGIDPKQVPWLRNWVGKQLDILFDPEVRGIFTKYEQFSEKIQSDINRELRAVQDLISGPGGHHLSDLMWRWVQGLVEPIRTGLAKGWPDPVLARAEQAVRFIRQQFLETAEVFMREGLLTEESVKKRMEEGGYTTWKYHKLAREQALIDVLLKETGIDKMMLSHLKSRKVLDPRPIKVALQTFLRKRTRTLGVAENLGLRTDIQSSFEGLAAQWAAAAKLNMMAEIADFDAEGNPRNTQYVRNKPPEASERAAYERDLETLNKAIRTYEEAMVKKGIPIDLGFPQQPTRLKRRVRGHFALMKHEAMMEAEGIPREGLPDGVEKGSDEAKAIEKAQKKRQRLILSVQRATDMKAPEWVPRPYEVSDLNEGLRDLYQRRAMLENYAKDWAPIPHRMEWGRLQGKYMRADLFEGIVNSGGMLGGGWRVWHAFLTTTKTGLTARSLRVFLVNLIGNETMFNMMGAPLELGRPKGILHRITGWKQTWKYMKYGERPKNDPLFDKFEADGGFRRTFWNVELARRVSDTAMETAREAYSLVQGGEPGKGLSTFLAGVFNSYNRALSIAPILGKVEFAYSISDMAQAYGFYRIKATGEGSTHRPMPDDQSLNFVKSYMDYSNNTVPPILTGAKGGLGKYVGRRGLLAFGTYPYKATTGGTRALTTRPVTLGIPLVRTGTILRPGHLTRLAGGQGGKKAKAALAGDWLLSMAGYAAPLFLIPLAAKAAYKRYFWEGSDEEWERATRSGAYGSWWRKVMSIPVMKDPEDGKPLLLDTWRYNPFGAVLDPIRAGRGDETVPQMMLRFNPLLSSAGDFIRAETWEGRDIYGWMGPSGWLYQTARPLIPGMIDYPLRDLMKGKLAEYTVPEFILKSVLGVKLNKANLLYWPDTRIEELRKEGFIRRGKIDWAVKPTEKHSVDDLWKIWEARYWLGVRQKRRGAQSTLDVLDLSMEEKRSFMQILEEAGHFK